MPRTLNRASQVYPPGTYGPFSIDSFTRNNTEYVEAALTVEGWPAVPVVAVLTLTMDDGSMMTVNVPGEPKNRDGTSASVFVCRLAIPADGVVIDGVVQPPTKRDVRGATITATVQQVIQTALTFRAV